MYSLVTYAIHASAKKIQTTLIILPNIRSEEIARI